MPTNKSFSSGTHFNLILNHGQTIDSRTLIVEAEGIRALENVETLKLQKPIPNTRAASELGRQLPDVEAPALKPARGSKRSLVDQLLRPRARV